MAARLLTLFHLTYATLFMYVAVEAMVGVDWRWAGLLFAASLVFAWLASMYAEDIK